GPGRVQEHAQQRVLVDRPGARTLAYPDALELVIRGTADPVDEPADQILIEALARQRSRERIEPRDRIGWERRLGWLEARRRAGLALRFLGDPRQQAFDRAAKRTKAQLEPEIEDPRAGDDSVVDRDARARTGRL